MNVPENVIVINEDPELGLKLYHYNDKAEHPSEASFWKGIVVADDKQVVARSFPWAPTVVVEPENKDALSEHDIYTPFYESTLIRFYRYLGKPMASTHRRINVMDTNSRVGHGRPFRELIDAAIKSWEYYEDVRDPTGTGKDKILVQPPSSWEDLCVEGYCHVFLLQDWSNQITNLNSLKEDIISEQSGSFEYLSWEIPHLTHSISFKINAETGGMDPIDGFMPPQSLEGGYFHLPFAGESEGWTDYDVTQMMYEVPTVSRLSVEQATSIIEDGGAVIGFDPERPDLTFKYFSPLYDRMITLAGETFNPVHRWFELMDESEEDATEYLEYIPDHHKGKNKAYMLDIRRKYTDETVQYIGDIVLRRFQRENASIDNRIWNKASKLIEESVQDLRRSMKSRISNQELRRLANKIVRDAIHALPYKTQHAIHGAIMRVTTGH